MLVNRVWMEHFGEPLVNSPADFGTRSDPPTHPELLDRLAAEFMRSGWSLKQLHRVMLLSSAYQQASSVKPAGFGLRQSSAAFEGRKTPNESGKELPHSKAQARPNIVDPDNRLLWHYPRRRLDLEAMRDALLAASGKLDLTMGGRPVEGASHLENCRRTVYGLVDRQDLPKCDRDGGCRVQAALSGT